MEGWKSRLGGEPFLGVGDRQLPRGINQAGNRPARQSKTHVAARRKGTVRTVRKTGKIGLFASWRTTQNEPPQGSPCGGVAGWLQTPYW